jgi:hypothetical protein
MQLIITNVGPADFGAYHCIAKNEMGITKGIFTLFGKLLQNSLIQILKLFINISKQGKQRK